MDLYIGYVFTGVCHSIHKEGGASAWKRVCLWREGVCMEILSTGVQPVVGTHPTGMHTCFSSASFQLSTKLPLSKKSFNAKLDMSVSDK